MNAVQTLPARFSGTARTGGREFLRGCVAGACLAAFQGRGSRNARHVSRLALQGGVAMAAGALSADALLAREYWRAATFAALGAAGVLAMERMLRCGADENDMEKM